MRIDGNINIKNILICLCLAILGSNYSTAIANPTLVVDIDTGDIEIHVGDTGPLPKTIWEQSGGDGSSSLTSGDWLASNFEILSTNSGFNGDGDNVADVVPSWTVGGNSLLGYAEFGFQVNIPEGFIFPLDITYNTTLDTRDVNFFSVAGLSNLPWNTLYIGEATQLPEPSSVLLGFLGVSALGLFRRR